jgi:hypothetical protein
LQLHRGLVRNQSFATPRSCLHRTGQHTPHEFAETAKRPTKFDWADDISKPSRHSRNAEPPAKAKQNTADSAQQCHAAYKASGEKDWNSSTQEHSRERRRKRKER